MSSISSTYHAISDAVKLSREEEIAVVAKIRQGDPRAMETLIVSQLKTVMACARHFAHCGMDFDDLVHEGIIGLQKAIERFNPRRGCRLSTYASAWIHLHISRSLTTKGHLIRPPVTATLIVRKSYRAWQELVNQLEREPSDDEIAEYIGVRPQRFRAIKTCLQGALPLDTKISGDDDALKFHELIPDPASLEDRQEELRAEQIDTVTRVIEDPRVLSKKEREILYQRYGLKGQQRLTRSEIGRRNNVTREWIRQIEVKALRKVRRSLKLKSGNEFAEQILNAGFHRPTRDGLVRRAELDDQFEESAFLRPIATLPKHHRLLQCEDVAEAA